MTDLLEAAVDEAGIRTESAAASLVAQGVKNLPAVRETWVQSLGQEDPLEKDRLLTPVFLGFRLQCGRPGFNPWVGKIPWRRKWQPTPILLPGKFHGLRSLVCYSPWGHKELDTTE